VILPLCKALVRHTWSAGSQAGLPSIRETGTYWSESSKGPQMIKGLENLSNEQRGAEKAQGDLINMYTYLMGEVKKMEPESS